VSFPRTPPTDRRWYSGFKTLIFPPCLRNAAWLHSWILYSCHPLLHERGAGGSVSPPPNPGIFPEREKVRHFPFPLLCLRLLLRLLFPIRLVSHTSFLLFLLDFENSQAHSDTFREISAVLKSYIISSHVRCEQESEEANFQKKYRELIEVISLSSLLSLLHSLLNETLQLPGHDCPPPRVQLPLRAHCTFKKQDPGTLSTPSHQRSSFLLQ